MDTFDSFTRVSTKTTERFGTKPTFLFEPESEFERLRDALRPSPVQHEVKERKPRIGHAGRILLYSFLIGAAFLIAVVMFIGAVGVC